MKKILFFLSLFPVLAFGAYNVTVSNVPYNVVLTAPGYMSVVNSGTNTVFANFGGHTTAADYSSFHPIRAAASYTTKAKYTFASFICYSNGTLNTTIDVGTETGP